MKKTNILQYSLAAGLGAFVSGAIALQFGQSVLWAAVGIFPGWFVAMFANDPKGFPKAIAGAFMTAQKTITGADYEGISTRFRYLGWFLLVDFAFLSTVFVFLVALASLGMSSLSIGGVMFVVAFSSFVIVWSEGICRVYYGVPEERKISGLREVFRYVNPIGAAYYSITGAWKHRTKIHQAIKVFFAEMFLYINENSGFSFLVHVSIGTVAGLLFGNVIACAVAGFAFAFIDQAIYSKSQESLRALVVDTK